MFETLARYNELSSLIINKPGSQKTALSLSLIDLEMYRPHSLAFYYVSP